MTKVHRLHDRQLAKAKRATVTSAIRSLVPVSVSSTLPAEEPKTFKIEKGIPIPTARQSHYPWDQMEIGDSILVATSQRYISSIAASAARTRGWRFVTRKVEGGTRVWRVE